MRGVGAKQKQALAPSDAQTKNGARLNKQGAASDAPLLSCP